MPHKRAKRSAREQQRKERGADLAPPGAGNGTTLSTEAIPKSISRVLEAARIRAEYRQKKRARQLEEGAHDGGDGHAPTLAKGKKRRRAAADSDAGKSTIGIQPGESLKHFNRRVEDHMRPLVQSAMRASAATERKERKAATVNGTPRESKARSSVGKAEGTTTTPSTAAGCDKGRDRPKEFATISSARPRRLNDIATAPPELKRLPRRRASDLGAKPARTKAVGSVLLMAQRAMMETERENVIRRYREMKERKAKDESEQAQTP
ncbi:hypothetical protein EDB92DRAFT_1827798 [Lactarius akahatsu]|uniref:Uncharacterized protein n=1 Tax=Lactarius akahatsu TaxID=416441 RepID=A0AAD4QDC1_9AGAM|nr:hypothetical protein EDB92DRAFT_1827798 [Lactarius akahatsu]